MSPVAHAVTEIMSCPIGFPGQHSVSPEIHGTITPGCLCLTLTRQRSVVQLRLHCHCAEHLIYIPSSSKPRRLEAVAGTIAMALFVSKRETLWSTSSSSMSATTTRSAKTGRLSTPSSALLCPGRHGTMRPLLASSPSVCLPSEAPPLIEFPDTPGQLLCAPFDHAAVNHYFADFLENSEDTFLRSHIGPDSAVMLNTIKNTTLSMADRLLDRVIENGNMDVLLERLRACGRDDLVEKLLQ